MDYRQATAQELEALWAYNVQRHPDDARWKKWAEEYIRYNQTGAAITFAVVDGAEPVGEGTLILSPTCKAVFGRDKLCDGARIANINALRIRKPYEGRGHISRLVRGMERCAVARGIERMTIGVEAKETRNLAIYLHWGYTEFLFSEVEDGELVLFLGKRLTTEPI